MLLLDGRDRVLLFRGGDPARPAAGTYWFTPGGGLEAGEDLPTAARRELAEETGLVDVELGPVVWRRRAEFEFEGVRYDAAEDFVLARVPALDVDDAGWTDLERRCLVEHRWWSVAELHRTGETVYPTTLAVELARLLRDGPPAAPVEVAG